MAPFTWENGWPELELVNGQWGASYPFPDVTCRNVPPRPSLDTFSSAELSHEWEWNHNPDDSKWSSGDGLILQTASVTTDIYDAKNTLTRRIEGPISTATIELDYSQMIDGDIAGLAAWRDSIAWIGIKKVGANASVVVKENMDLQIDNWESTTPGSEVASQAVTGGKIWLRMEGNIRTDAGGGTAKFFYSTNGTSFTQLGGTFAMERSWNYFLGYRFGLFNYATKALGGQVQIASFAITKP
jgi:beta-xylosidase